MTARRSALALAVVAALLVAGDFLFTAHYVKSTQDEQRRQGAAVERAICEDLGTMAAIKPPAGNPAANPSRAYEDAEHRAWSGLYAGLGCRRH